MTIRRLVRPERHDRRAFLGYAATCVASVVLGACSRTDTPTSIASPVPSIAFPLDTKTPPPVPNVPDATGAPAARASTTDAPRASVSGAGTTGLGQGVTTLAAQRAFISPLDPAWSYSSGPWARLPHPGWPTDRMAAVMSAAWVRAGKVIKGGVGRRCAIVTNSPIATILVEGDGQSFSIALDDAPAMRIGPLSTDGSMIEIPLFAGRSGMTRIEMTFDMIGANDGLYIVEGAGVFPVPEKAMPRLVILGNGYAQGVGASAPGVTSCSALIGERLHWETINQGWQYTDVDVRSGEQGDPENSGLDRVVTDVVALTPMAVLLIYGLQAASAPRPSWEYAYHYADMLRRIRTALPSSPIFCSGFPPCNGNLSAAYVQEWNAALRSASSTVDNCPFIEAADWWGPENYFGGSGPVYVAGDNVHPNDMGHQFLADKYADAIAQHQG